MPRHHHPGRHPGPRDRPTAAQPLILLALGLFVLGFAIALLKILLPFLLLTGLGYGGWKFWQRRQQRQQEQEAARQARERQLDLAFYQLVRQHRGEFTVLDFAMATQASTEFARQYLNRKAIDLDAQFKTTPEGQVLYCFYSATMASEAVQVADAVLPDESQS